MFFVAYDDKSLAIFLHAYWFFQEILFGYTFPIAQEFVYVFL